MLNFTSHARISPQDIPKNPKFYREVAGETVIITKKSLKKFRRTPAGEHFVH